MTCIVADNVPDSVVYVVCVVVASAVVELEENVAIVAVVTVVNVVNCWLVTKGADNNGITDKTNTTERRNLLKPCKESRIISRRLWPKNTLHFNLPAHITPMKELGIPSGQILMPAPSSEYVIH